MESQEVIFIQVGSNEGIMDTDPLCSFILNDKWRGVLIEPVPRIFEKLKKNYAGHSQLNFENVAISNTRKISEFYVVDETAEFFTLHPSMKNEAGGLWGDLIGSLDRDHIFKCKPILSDAEIKTIQVPCLTLQDIVDKYQFDHVDVIHLDAEGHDDVILLSINFEKIQPKLIIFEHVHLTFDRYQSCIEHLQNHGYSVIHTGLLDTIAGNPWIK